MLPELELELLGSEIFHRAGAGAYKLQTFLLELELELRVLVKNVGAKSGATKVMFQVSLETHLKLYLYNIFLDIIKKKYFKVQQYRKFTLKKGFSNPHLAFYLEQMDNPN